MQLIDWLRAGQDNNLDEGQMVLDLQKTVAEAVTGILEAATFGVLEAAPLDEVIGFFTGLEQTIINTRRAELDNTTSIEDWQEYLYCAIKQATPQKLTEAIYQDWATNSVRPTETGTYLEVARFSNFLLNLISWQKVKARYIIYSYDKQNDCALLEWCPESPACLNTWLQLTTSQECSAARPLSGTYPTSPTPAGEWIDGSGWRSIVYQTGSGPSSGKYCSVQVYVPFGEPCDLTYIDWSWGYTGPAMSTHSIWKMNSASPDDITQIATMSNSLSSHQWGVPVSNAWGVLFVAHRAGTVQSPPNTTPFYLQTVEITGTPV